MHDRARVLLGLAIFLALVLFPIWFSFLGGGLAATPAVAKPAGEEHCVESVETMRTSHMRLLDVWRDDAVRNGDHTHVDPWGGKHEKSLVKSCLGCHRDPGYTNFCQKCHDYTGVSPNCWECHVIPEGQ
jgi:hypothetical protein